LLLAKSSLSQTESDFGNGDVNLFHGQPSIVAGHNIKYNQSFSSALEHMHKKPCFQGLLRHLSSVGCKQWLRFLLLKQLKLSNAAWQLLQPFKQPSHQIRDSRPGKLGLSPVV
jgi:hypothetical protein